MENKDVSSLDTMIPLQSRNLKDLHEFLKLLASSSYNTL